MSELVFRPIDPARDGDVAIGFMREVFAVSFDDDRFTREFGADGAGYLTWLAERTAGDPGAAVFALDGEAPVGLVVTGRYPDDPSIGYVYTYYLAPQARGRGLADRLDDHAMAVLRARGHARARLSVAEKNRPAWAFYARRGWTLVGPRPDQPGIVYLEKAVPAG